MKTIIIASIFVLMCLGSLTSCRKDYVCQCYKTYTRSNGTTFTESDGLYTFNDSKPRAQERCNQQEGSGADLSGEYTRDCEIK